MSSIDELFNELQELDYTKGLKLVKKPVSWVSGKTGAGSEFLTPATGDINYIFYPQGDGSVIVERPTADKFVDTTLGRFKDKDAAIKAIKNDFKQNYVYSLVDKEGKEVKSFHKLNNAESYINQEERAIRMPQNLKPAPADFTQETGTKKDPQGYVYRGMSGKEWKEARKRGYIKSDGRLNLSHEDDKTLYAREPRTSYSYATNFAPEEYRPKKNKPTYIVQVKPTPGMEIQHGTNYIQTPEKVPLSNVARVYKITPDDKTSDGYRFEDITNRFIKNEPRSRTITTYHRTTISSASDILRQGFSTDYLGKGGGFGVVEEPAGIFLSSKRKMKDFEREISKRPELSNLTELLEVKIKNAKVWETTTKELRSLRDEWLPSYLGRKYNLTGDELDAVLRGSTTKIREFRSQGRTAPLDAFMAWQSYDGELEEKKEFAKHIKDKFGYNVVHYVDPLYKVDQYVALDPSILSAKPVKKMEKKFSSGKRGTESKLHPAAKTGVPSSYIAQHDVLQQGIEIIEGIDPLLDLKRVLMHSIEKTNITSNKSKWGMDRIEYARKKAVYTKARKTLYNLRETLLKAYKGNQEGYSSYVNLVDQQLSANLVSLNVANRINSIFKEVGIPFSYLIDDAESKTHGSYFPHVVGGKNPSDFEGGIELTGRGVASRETLDTLLHELGHRQDDIIRSKNLSGEFTPVSPESITQLSAGAFTTLFRQEYFDPMSTVRGDLTKESLAFYEKLGFSKEKALEHTQYLMQPTEIVARNFSLAIQGKPLEHEGLRPVIDMIINNMTPADKKLIRKLKKALPEELAYKEMVDEMLGKPNARPRILSKELAEYKLDIPVPPFGSKPMNKQERNWQKRLEAIDAEIEYLSTQRNDLLAQGVDEFNVLPKVNKRMDLLTRRKESLLSKLESRVPGPETYPATERRTNFVGRYLQEMFSDLRMNPDEARSRRTTMLMSMMKELDQYIASGEFSMLIPSEGGSLGDQENKFKAYRQLLERKGYSLGEPVFQEGSIVTTAPVTPIPGARHYRPMFNQPSKMPVGFQPPPGYTIEPSAEDVRSGPRYGPELPPEGYIIPPGNMYAGMTREQAGLEVSSELAAQAAAPKKKSKAIGQPEILRRLRENLDFALEDAQALIEAVRNAGTDPNKLTNFSLDQLGNGGYRFKGRYEGGRRTPIDLYRQSNGGFGTTPPPTPPTPPTPPNEPPEEPQGRRRGNRRPPGEMLADFWQQYRERGGPEVDPLRRNAPMEQRNFEEQLGRGIAGQMVDLDRLGSSYNAISTSLSHVGDGVVKLTTKFKDGRAELRTYHQYIVDVNGELQSFDLQGYRQYLESRSTFTPAQLQGFTSNPVLQGAFKSAQRRGFSPEDLKYIREEASTGHQRLMFEQEDAFGKKRQYGMMVSPEGRMLPDTQRRYQGVAGGIMRDMGEVFKWGIAVSVMYAPLQKMQQLIVDMIANEAKLADVTIALGNAQADTNKIFGDAATIASATGESITGVLDGYILATRAAGSVEDKTQRVVVANKLMYDSLILSKLSALNQAQALDILSASLRQVYAELGSAESLSKGSELIDKWIATTKAANVDLATLATSFSIVSEQAENAGIGAEQLNAMIAILSEKMGAMSAEETGNAMRAVIGGMYSDAAAKELANYGIAVTDVTGKQRGFLEVSTEIYNLWKAGVVSDEDINKLSRAIGGGVRRQAVVSAFMTGQGRIPEIVAAQQGATGLGQEALRVQMETTQTALTELGNSFLKLAQSLGSEGGVLGMIKTLLDLATKTIDIITLVTKTLGTSAPVALAGLISIARFSGSGGQIAYNATTSRMRDNATDWMTGMTRVGGPLGWLFGRTSPEQSRFERAAMGWTPGMTPSAQARLERTDRFSVGFGNVVGKYGMGAGILALGALNSASNGDSYGEVGAEIGAGVVGLLLTAGNPIGAVIGQTIADVFIREAKRLENYEFTLKGLFEVGGTTGGGGGGEKSRVETDAQRLERQAKDAEESAFDYGISLLRKYTPSTGGELSEQQVRRNLSLSEGFRETMNSFFSNFGETGVKNEEITPEKILLMELEKSGAPKEEIAKVYARLKKAEELATTNAIVTPDTENLDYATEKQQLTYNANKEMFVDLGKQFRKELYGKFAGGEITAKQYRDMLSEIPSLGISAGRTYYALSTKVNAEQKGMETVTPQQNLADIAKIRLFATPEQLQAIDQMSEEVTYLDNAIQKAWDTGAQNIDFHGSVLSLNEAIAKQAELWGDNAAAIKTVGDEAMIAMTKLPNITDLSDYTFKQYQQFAPELEKIYQDLIKNFTPDQQKVLESMRTNEQKNAFVSFQDLFATGEQANLVPEAVRNLVMQKATATGVLPSPKGAGFKYYDASTEQIRNAERISNNIAAFMRTKGIELPQQFTAVLSNESLFTINANAQIMEALLSDILDTEKKQLDGIYNLPQGANAYIPLEAARYVPGGGGGGGSMKDALYAWIRSMGGDPEKLFAGLETPNPTTITGVGQTLLPGATPFTATYGLPGLTTVDQNPLRTPYIPPVTSATRPIWMGNNQQIWDWMSGKPIEDTGAMTKNPLFMKTEAPKVIQIESLKPLKFEAAGTIPVEVIGPIQLENYTGIPLENYQGVPTEIPIVPTPTPTPSQTPQGSLFEQFFGGLGMGLSTVLPMGSALLNPLLSQPNAGTSPVVETPNTTVVTPPISLRLNVNSNIKLMVDGRMLANVIKPYLYDDLLRSEGGSAITKNFTV